MSPSSWSRAATVTLSSRCARPCPRSGPPPASPCRGAPRQCPWGELPRVRGLGLRARERSRLRARPQPPESAGVARSRPPRDVARDLAREAGHAQRQSTKHIFVNFSICHKLRIQLETNLKQVASYSHKCLARQLWLGPRRLPRRPQRGLREGASPRVAQLGV